MNSKTSSETQSPAGAQSPTGGVSRRQQRVPRAEAQERLVSAAAELVCEVGPTGITLANVGERAGYSRGLVTHHFGSKAALMQRLLTEVDRQFRAALLQEHRPDSVTEQLHEFLDVFFDVIADPLPINRARLVLWAHAISAPADADIRPAMLAADRAFHSALEVPLREAVSTGEVAGDTDPTALASVIIAMLRGVAVQALGDSDIDLSACRNEIELLIASRLQHEQKG